MRDNKFHIVSVIDEMGWVESKIFMQLDNALNYFEYKKSLPQDKYSNSRRYVYLEENVTVEENQYLIKD